MNQITTLEFIRRLLIIQNEFKNYKLKISIYYQNAKEVKEKLNEQNIKFEEFHGFYYNTMNEDIYDDCIMLNVDQNEILKISYKLSHLQFDEYPCIYGLNHKKHIYNVLLYYPIPESFYDYKQLNQTHFKTLIESIYGVYRPIEFVVKKSKKRCYEQIEFDDGVDKIKHDITVVTTKEKKFKV
jgi:hypothetical protein